MLVSNPIICGWIVNQNICINALVSANNQINGANTENILRVRRCKTKKLPTIIPAMLEIMNRESVIFS